MTKKQFKEKELQERPRSARSLDRALAQLSSGNHPSQASKKPGWRNKTNYNSNPVKDHGQLKAGNKQKYHKHK